MVTLVSSFPEDKSTVLLAECALTAFAVAFSFLFPRLGSSWFARIERAFMRLARRPALAIAVVGFSAILLRAAIIPLFPVPIPAVPNDFSFLLAADTFAHGRLTNPMPAMWTHFESIDITVQPTYMSMFFPGWGLALGAAQAVFGQPWIASLCLDGLMCAGICWMLQSWLPPGWALLGGLLAALRLGLFTVWINTVSGGNGLLDAFAGALILGALPRLLKSLRIRDGLLLSAGIGMLAITRPFEGLLLCIPVAVVLARWAWNGKNRPAPSVLFRCASLPLALLFAFLAWLGYYDFRNFGSPATLPYTVALDQYAVAPKFVFQRPLPEPAYRHPFMRRYYVEDELAHFNDIHSLSGYFPAIFGKFVFATFFLAGFALLPPLIMARRVWLDRRVRFLAVCAGMLVVAMLLESFFISEYLAPFTAVFYALGLQAMRHLRVWRPAGVPAGRAIVRLSIAVCVLVAAFTLLNAASRHAFGQPTFSRYEQPGGQRAQTEARLEQLPGKQLVFVRYLPTHDPLDIWVYNRADLDAAKVIWAWDMGPIDNLVLMHYYPGRTAWLAQPDNTPAILVPYAVPAASLAGSPKPSGSGS